MVPSPESLSSSATARSSAPNSTSRALDDRLRVRLGHPGTRASCPKGHRAEVALTDFAAGTVRGMTDETPDYMTDELPEYEADEFGDHEDLLDEGRLGHIEHLGAKWRTGFVKYGPDGHSVTVRLVAEGMPKGEMAITDFVVSEALALVSQQVASVNHVDLELKVRSDNPITRVSG